MRLLLLTLLAFVGLPAWATTVALAGMSYSGDYQSINARFPYSQRFAKSLAAENLSPDLLLGQVVAQTKIDNFTVQQGELAQLKGSDQAIAVSLVITNEIVSYERFGGAYKLFINVRGQVLFFDFKSMSVLRSYPVTGAYLDVVRDHLSDAELDDRVRQIYRGSGPKQGLLQKFAAQLASTTLPQNVPRFLQVSKVSIAPDVLKEMPSALTSTPGTAETWLADQLSEAIAVRAGVPVLPYAKGYAIGNKMSMRFADGTVFNLKIPEADYSFSVDLTQFKRVKTGESVAGINLVYGAFMDVKLIEPISNRVYLDAKLKNGESKQVPVTQSEVDDFPAYSEAVRGLLQKFSAVLGGKDDPWLKTASAGGNIDSQISATRTVLQSCK